MLHSIGFTTDKRATGSHSKRERSDWQSEEHLQRILAAAIFSNSPDALASDADAAIANHYGVVPAAQAAKLVG